MTSKHLFYSAEGLVVKGLRGAIAYNPALALIEESRVVYDTTHSTDSVSIISGGGAGHEPAWAGYVGKNMLASSVSGDIFASPSTKQILAGLEAVPSNKGSILVVTNYTGDCLHFGLACEKANALNGPPCGMIICGDDVSVGKKGSLVGRRGLAAQIAVLKIMGAASSANASFDQLMKLGQAIADQIVSIAATLDHCHVPGRSEHAMLKADEVEIGTGPHNEPGYRKLSPIPSPEEYVRTILKYCLDEADPERGYVHFEPNDETVLCVSNFGGMSVVEMGALVDELLSQLETDYKISPTRIYSGPLETSLNAPAFSVSVINLTAASRNAGFTVDQIKDFLDVKTNTQWEAVAGEQSGRQRGTYKSQIQAAPKHPEKIVDDSSDLKVDSESLEKMLRSACDALVEREPDLTRWDTVMGDGDCGETLKTGATSLLAALGSGLVKNGSTVAVLQQLEDIVESKMGGTLGGILGIFFVSLTASLQKGVRAADGKPSNVPQLWGASLNDALAALGRYTPAKVGDRTVMDVLIPFAESLGNTGDFEKATREAEKAAEATKTMSPKLGRATYVGDMQGKELPPDPGAWGAMEAIRGLYLASK